MAKQSKKDIQAALELLKQQAKTQAEINGSLEGYLEGVRESKLLHETINANNAIAQKIKLEIQEAANANDTKAIKLGILKLKLLNKETRTLENNLNILNQQLATVNKTNLAAAKLGATLVKGFVKLPGFVKNSFGKLKGYGLFDMEKSIKMSSLQMGLLSKQSDFYRTSIVKASVKTNQLGIGVEDDFND